MMQAHGLDPVDISALLIVWSVSAFVFEVPSGTIGDRFSRRRVLLVSRCFQAAAFIVWWLFPGFPGYALGFVIWGLAGSLWSGTNEALLFEALTERSEGHRFDEVYGRGSACGTLGVAAALASGGWLAADGYTLPLWLSAGMSILVGLGVFFSFGDPPVALRDARQTVALRDPTQTVALRDPTQTVALRDPTQAVAPRDAGRAEGTPFKQALRDFATRPLIRHMALAIGLGLVYYGCFEEYVGLVFTEAGLSLTAMGVWYAACYGARSVGMAIAPRFRFDPMLVLVASGLALAPAGIAPSVGLLLTSCIAYFALNGIAEVRIVTILQNEQSGGARATVMSLARLGILATGPLVYLATGALANFYGWIAAAWIAAAGTTATALALRFTAPRTTPHPATSA